MREGEEEERKKTGKGRETNMMEETVGIRGGKTGRREKEVRGKEEGREGDTVEGRRKVGERNEGDK